MRCVGGRPWVLERRSFLIGGNGWRRSCFLFCRGPRGISSRFRKVQFIAPRYANLPGEYAPVGFYAWTATWLERYRDVYFTVWKIGEADQPLIVDELPSTAFDSPEEKARVAELFSEYNASPDLEISPELDREFAEIARERTRRHPLRTYVFVPFQRALTIWFTPRTELLPIDGKFWPVREQWEDSHADVLVTGWICGVGLSVCRAGGLAGVWARLACQWRDHRNGPASGSGQISGELPLCSLIFWFGRRF